MVDDACNVHYPLLLDLVQDSVDGDQSPRPTHTRTGGEGAAQPLLKNESYMYYIETNNCCYMHVGVLLWDPLRE